MYRRPIAGTTLYLISLTESFEDYDPLSETPLSVTWSPPGDAVMRVRAESIERDLYYRMDAERPGDSALVWPTGVLAAQGIGQSRIGVTGWSVTRLGDEERTVYVPLRISQRGQTLRCGHYTVLLWPGVRLDEVYVSLAALDSTGSPTTSVKQNEPLGYGYYPAERAIEVDLTGFAAAGLYALDISAARHDGGTQAVHYWIYHTPPPAPCGG